MRFVLLFVVISNTSAACHSATNEFQCEHDAGDCFWCTLNQGITYKCYTTAEAHALKNPSCSHPVPPAHPTPPSVSNETGIKCMGFFFNLLF